MKKTVEDIVHERRTFLRSATSSIGLILTAPVIATIVSACETDETPSGPSGTPFDVDISAYPELSDVGGITIDLVTGLNSGNPVFISRVDTETFAVFTAVCTHNGCIVDPPIQAEPTCVCPCHGSEFSRTDGKVKVQPSTGSASDLQTFSTSFEATTSILTIFG